jgi:hypothetical protein
MDFLNHREGGMLFYQVLHILVSVRKNFMDHSHRRLSESQNKFPEEGYWKDLQYYAVFYGGKNKLYFYFLHDQAAKNLGKTVSIHIQISDLILNLKIEIHLVTR